MFSFSHLTNSILSVDFKVVIAKWRKICHNHLRHVQTFFTWYVTDISFTVFLQTLQIAATLRTTSDVIIQMRLITSHYRRQPSYLYSALVNKCNGDIPRG